MMDRVDPFQDVTNQDGGFSHTNNGNAEDPGIAAADMSAAANFF